MITALMIAVMVALMLLRVPVSAAVGIAAAVGIVSESFRSKFCRA